MEKQYEENQKELETLSESLTKMNCQMQIHLKVGPSIHLWYLTILSSTGDPVEVCLVHRVHDTQQMEQRRGVHVPQWWHWAPVCAGLTSAPKISLYSHTVVTGIGFAMYVMSGSVFLLNEWTKFFILFVENSQFRPYYKGAECYVQEQNRWLVCTWFEADVFHPRLISEWVQDTIVGISVNFETSWCVFVSAV